MIDIERLRRESESGSLGAQTALGTCYLDGIQVEADYAEALRLLSTPASHGVPRAVSNLARMYAAGLEVPQDLAKAFRMHHFAADRGEFFSLVALARMYVKGEGTAADASKARELYLAVLAEEPKLFGCDEELREARAYLASGAGGGTGGRER